MDASGVIAALSRRVLPHSSRHRWSVAIVDVSLRRLCLSSGPLGVLGSGCFRMISLFYSWSLRTGDPTGDAPAIGISPDGTTSFQSSCIRDRADVDRLRSRSELPPSPWQHGLCRVVTGGIGSSHFYFIGHPKSSTPNNSLQATAARPAICWMSPASLPRCHAECFRTRRAIAGWLPLWTSRSGGCA